jgi:hypothetical protein
MPEILDREKDRGLLRKATLRAVIAVGLGLGTFPWAGTPAAQGPAQTEYVSLDDVCLYAKGLKHRALTKQGAGLAGEMYLDALHRKLQRSSLLFQPQSQDGHTPGGRVSLEIVLRANGTLCGYRPVTPAASPALAEAAARHLQYNAPFAPLPPSVSETADVVHITQSWSYREQYAAKTSRHRLKLHGSGSEHGVRGTARYELAVPLQ